MKVKNYSTELSDIKICSGVYFSDERGSLKKAIHGDEITMLMPNIREVLCTTSQKNVIRGLHYQEEPHQIKKFITCIKGEVLDIFVDIRKQVSKDSRYLEVFEKIKHIESRIDTVELAQRMDAKLESDKLQSLGREVQQLTQLLDDFQGTHVVTSSLRICPAS